MLFISAVFSYYDLIDHRATGREREVSSYRVNTGVSIGKHTHTRTLMSVS